MYFSNNKLNLCSKLCAIKYTALPQSLVTNNVCWRLKPEIALPAYYIKLIAWSAFTAFAQTI